MWTKTIYILCVFLSLMSQSNQQNDHQQQKNDLLLAEKWKKASSINTFQETVKEYPFLIQNIKLEKFIDFIDLGICQFTQGDPGRYIIIDNQVYLYGGQKNYQRTQHYQKYLQKILKKYKVPDMYLLIHIYDGLFPKLIKQQAIERCRSIPMFVFNKNLSQYVSKTKFLLPDNYITIDQWPSMIEQVKNLSLKYQWKNKIPKLFYRGACVGPFWHDRKIIPSPITREVVLKYCHRCGYVVLSNQRPDMVDARLTTKCLPELQLTKYLVNKYGQSNLYGDFLQFTQQGKYRYLLYADGASSSWRRAASFLFSSSVLVMPFSQNVQWFYQHLLPNVNFVLVDSGLQDTLDKMKQLQQNETKAMQIIKNANNIAQMHLTFDAMANFTIRQITKYATIQNLTLSQQQKNDIKRGIDAQLVLKLKVMRQQWEVVNENVAFKNIVKNFPKINQNIEILKLIQMSDNGCNISLAKFIIIDNKVYCQGQNCLKKNAKGIQKHINKLLNDHIISDLYFLIRVDQVDLQNSNILQKSQSCKDLPYFVFSKDPQSEDQKNKFLFPHPDFDQWQNQTINFTKNIKNIGWNQKKNRTLFGGVLDQQFNLIKKSRRFRFIKKLTEIKNSKEDYFEAYTQRYFQPRTEAVSNINENFKYLIIAQEVNTKYRVSQLLAMLSKVVVLSPKIKRISWLDEFLIPGKHYVQLKEDLSNLKYTIQLLKQNDQKIKQISEVAFDVASSQVHDKLTHRYISQILQNYSQVQKLTLSNQQKQKFLNGTPFYQIIKNKQKQQPNRLKIVFQLTSFLLLIFICYKIMIQYKKMEEKHRQQIEQQNINYRD